jgi:hypothetical protein
MNQGPLRTGHSLTNPSCPFSTFSQATALTRATQRRESFATSPWWASGATSPWWASGATSPWWASGRHPSLTSTAVPGWPAGWRRAGLFLGFVAGWGLLGWDFLVVLAGFRGLVFLGRWDRAGVGG